MIRKLSVRKKLIYVGIVLCVIILASLIATIIASRKITNQFELMNNAVENTRGAFELTILSQDVLNKRTIRSINQWKDKIASLKKASASYYGRNSNVKYLHSKIQNNIFKMEKNFSKMVTILNSQEITYLEEIQLKQLGSQLLYLAHKSANWSQRLSEISKENTEQLQNQAVSIILFFSIISFLLVAYLVLSSVNRITIGLSDVRERIYALVENRKSINFDSIQSDEFDELTQEFFEMSQSIEKQYSELIKDLSSAKLTAQRSSEAKLNFLANVSHEIRTPISIILGFSELLGYSENLDKSDRENVENITSNANLLGRLINELLDLSKIEAGKVELEKSKIEIKDFLNEIGQQFRKKAEEKSLLIDIIIDENVPLLIESDSERIRQVVYNLFSNALKFTEKGSITLRCHFDNIKKQIEISVKDTGIGIGKNIQKKLFTPFEQGDASISKKFGGTGLGLSISRKMANLLGGNLYLKESKLGKGSIFVFSLPLELEKSTSEFSKNITDTFELTNSLKNKKVLYVDDNKDSRLLVKKVFRSIDSTKLTLASSGIKAIEICKDQTFDLILMDLQMPQIDGVQTSVKLKELGVQAPIVALTAYPMNYSELINKENVEKIFFTFLAKPFSRSIYSKLVREIDESTAENFHSYQ